MEEPSRRYFLGVALIGMAILVFETILTRIFAVTLWYYFGFLAISIALLGISAGGMVVYAVPRLGKRRLDATLALCSGLFAITALLAILFHLNVTFIGTEIGDASFFLRIMSQVLVLTIPFFFGGLCLALMFTRFHERIARIYFFDLAGSGIGCVLVIVALHSYSGPAIVFLVATLAALAALAFAPRTHRWAYATLLVICAASFVLNDRLELLTVRTTKSYRFATLQQNEKAMMLAEEWSPISRTTVFGPYKDPSQKLLFLHVDNNAGAPTRIHAYRGSLEAMRYTAVRAGKLPHHLVGGHHLLIGAGGGYEIWASLVTGHTVVAVEINPITTRWVREDFAEFSGNPYDQPGVTAVVGEGRSFVAHTDERFDIVELTMVDSWIGNAAGAFMFVENNLYTVEAMHAYRSRLTDDGVMTISRYYPYNEGLRVAVIMSQALIEDGIEDPGAHMMVVRDRTASVATVMAFQKPITPERARAAASMARQLRAVMIYSPHLTEADFSSEGVDDVNFRKLLNPTTHGTTRERFIAEFPRDISPTTDDQPFFFYMQKGSVFDTDPEEHAARSLALPIVYSLFVSLVVLSVLFLVVPALWVRRRSGAGALPPILLLLYFACLGVGFMLVEIPLIQKFVLFLGHPTYAFTVILSSILVFSGIGSYLSSRIELVSRPRRLAAILGITVAVLVVTLVTVDPLLHALLSLPLAARMAFTVLYLAPAAILMGMPFPSGIRLLGELASGSIPWAWAINGAFSVLATVLSLVVALNYGLRMALAIGCFSYVCALVLILLHARSAASGVAPIS